MLRANLVLNLSMDLFSEHLLDVTVQFFYTVFIAVEF